MNLNETNAALRTVEVYIEASGSSAGLSGHSWSAGEVVVSKNGGAFANTTNLPTALSGGRAGSFTLTLTTTEVNTTGPIRVQFFPAGGAGKFVELADVVEVTSVGGIADAVWDEARAGHATSGTYGEGVNVVTIASTAANTIRDAILNYAFRSGRTVRGWMRRTDSFVTNKVTGLLGALATFYQPDGTTVEYTAAQDTALGTRQTGTVTNSETP